MTVNADCCWNISDWSFISSVIWVHNRRQDNIFFGFDAYLLLRSRLKQRVSCGIWTHFFFICVLSYASLVKIKQHFVWIFTFFIYWHAIERIAAWNRLSFTSKHRSLLNTRLVLANLVNSLFWFIAVYFPVHDVVHRFGVLQALQ